MAEETKSKQELLNLDKIIENIFAQGLVPRTKFINLGLILCQPISKDEFGDEVKINIKKHAEEKALKHCPISKKIESAYLRDDYFLHQGYSAALRYFRKDNGENIPHISKKFYNELRKFVKTQTRISPYSNGEEITIENIAYILNKSGGVTSLVGTGKSVEEIIRDKNNGENVKFVLVENYAIHILRDSSYNLPFSKTLIFDKADLYIIEKDYKLPYRGGCGPP